MDLYEIVMKLNGPIHPMGDHNVDTWRLKNIKKLTELVDRLLFDIHQVSDCMNRPEASIKAIGAHAHEFLEDLKKV